MHIVVVGAGVVGTTTAWALWKDGHAVTVVERSDGAGLGTSFANGAILHPSTVQPWPAPGLPRKLLGWLGKEDAPFLIRLGVLPGMLGWSWRFLRHCNEDDYREGCRANLELALASLDVVDAIRRETGLHHDENPGAVVKIFRDPASLEKASREAEWLSAFGLAVERYDAAGARALDASLAGQEGQIAGVLRFPQDEIGDCHLFTLQLAAWLAERGVTFLYGCRVAAIRMSRGSVCGVQTDAGPIEADAVVLAAGSDAPRLSRPLGVRLPIAPVRGFSLTAPRRAWNDAPSKALLFDDEKFALVPVGDRLRVAGTAKVAGFDPTPNTARVEAVIARVVQRFPAFRRCAEHPDAKLWGGLRPVSADGRPIIGPTRVEGLFVNGGHGHMGWTLAGGSAKRLAAAIAEQTA